MTSNPIPAPASPAPASVRARTQQTPAVELPKAIHVLAFGIFAMVTSEFQVSGMVPVMAADLKVTFAEIGYLVSIYALAMAIGGPLLTAAILRFPPKRALLTLYAVFIAGEVLGAVAGSYTDLIFARLITGVASGAFYGIAISLSVRIASPQLRGRAISIVLSGIMFGTVLGLPLASLVGEQLGWRESFWLTSGIATAAAMLSMAALPYFKSESEAPIGDEIRALRNPRLWAAFSTSLLIIGGTFAGFTYFTPILQNVTNISPIGTTVILFAYGVATVFGNYVVGRLADKHTIATLVGGTFLLSTALLTFAFFAHVEVVAILGIISIGLFGVSLNPAMATRVMRAANAGPLVNTCHTSVITFGILVGSSLGGVLLDLSGNLRAPLWLGSVMALLAFVTVVPGFGMSRVSRKAGAAANR